MLLIDLKMLDETITFYENLSKELQEQFNNYLAIRDELFASWQGPHAQTCQEKISSLLYGPSPDSFTEGEVASLLAVEERTGKILDGLKAGQEVFQAEMCRCEELFYHGLTSTETIYGTEPSSNTAYGGKLFIDYDKAEEIGMKLQSLLDNECALGEIVANSQMGRWNDILRAFKKSPRYSDYDPGYSDFEVQHILMNEYTEIQNFLYSVVKYKENLAGIEEALVTVFGEQTSDYAKGMTRQIYEVSADGLVNSQRIRYLSQKNPDSFTPGEMDEIHRILLYTAADVSQMDPDSFSLWSQQIVIQALCINDSDKMDMDKLFRGYSTALHTKYATDVSRLGDIDQLSEYFYKNTLQKLTAVDGSLNSDQLKAIMELNPDSLTVGDCKALSEVFDSQVAGVDMQAMEHANLFLANCYIGERNPVGKIDADRSPVFDLWANYYSGLAVNQTTDEDFKALESTADDDVSGVNIKFLKQALLQIVSSDAALKLQVHGGFSQDDTETWIPQMGIFEIENIKGGKIGDYHLLMEQSYMESARRIEIDYYGYRRSEEMFALFTNDAISELKKYNIGFLDYAKSKGVDIITSKITGNVVGAVKDLAGTAGMAFSLAVGVGEAGIGWNEQTKKNKELAETLSRYYEGRRLKAYQMGGQIMYVDGVIVVNNDRTDEAKLEELEAKFIEQISQGTNNRCYSELFPEDCDEATRKSIEKVLQDSYSADSAIRAASINSVEFKTAFINWYHEGKGDSNSKSGEYYRNNGGEE